MIPAAAASTITTIIKVRFWSFRDLISSSQELSWLSLLAPEEEFESESADLMPEAVMPPVGNNGGPSASIGQIVSSPVGNYKLRSAEIRRNWIDVAYSSVGKEVESDVFSALGLLRQAQMPKTVLLN
jgi:hypothetical protein